ncbi:MAG TPA: TIGR03067 domain-containing protein [Gemmataceae bacterium]|jgi:uncharacterized protein (TIGR03067 family)|nr:TIGR03067 domain-containing protein [Gemmataceae bacterium]
MKALFVIAACFTLFTGARGLEVAKDEKVDPAKLDGAWTITAWEQGGATMPLERLSVARMTIKGDQYNFELGAKKEEGALKLDAGTSPTSIDLTISSGTEKGERQLGICRVEGDSLTICLARPGMKDRPTEFTSTKANRQVLMTLQRTTKGK